MAPANSGSSSPIAPHPFSLTASRPTLSWAALLHVCLVAASLGKERTAAHFLQASTLSKDL